MALEGPRRARLLPHPSPSSSCPPSERRITNRENAEAKDFKRVCVGLLGRLSPRTTQQGLQHLKCAVSQFWGPQAPDQADSRVGPSEGCKGESIPGLSVARRYPSSPYLFLSFSVSRHVCVSTFSPFHKGTSHTQ